MVDVVIIGWGVLRYIRDFVVDYGFVIYGYRVMYVVFMRNLYYGILMFVFVKFYRFIGID